MMNQYQRKRTQKNIVRPKLFAPVSSRQRLVGEQVYCTVRVVHTSMFPLHKCFSLTYVFSIVVGCSRCNSILKPALAISPLPHVNHVVGAVFLHCFAYATLFGM